LPFSDNHSTAFIPIDITRRRLQASCTRNPGVCQREQEGAVAQIAQMFFLVCGRLQLVQSGKNGFDARDGNCGTVDPAVVRAADYRRMRGKFTSYSRSAARYS
jgi:hypothetical protein